VGKVESRRRKRLTIAIDGPSGAGKSTVAKALAKKLGYTYIDTGAMYRAVALKAREKGIRTDEETSLNTLASSLRISFLSDPSDTRVFCDGEDVTEAIRSPEMGVLASDISRKRGVREALVQRQREMGEGGGAVMEGRDIGTVVFPHAEVKFYLDALPEERARRRFRELTEKGLKVGFQEILQEVVTRDQNDMSRDVSPLRKADDAVLIDSTHRSVDEVVEEMVRWVRTKGK
jgi:cytidylate kinase